MRKIIPVISGSTNIPNIDLKPDFYDGARFSDIDATVREDLSSNNPFRHKRN